MSLITFQNKLNNSLELNKNLIAIEENDMFVSYAELFATAEKITRFLLSKGIGKETIVGIFVASKFQMISSIIGIVNAGCIFAPLDPMLPNYRLKEMIHDMSMNYVITTKDIEYNRSITDLDMLYIEDLLKWEEEDYLVRNINYQDNDGLYVYFTSGSTGKPKGIVGKNSSLSQFLDWEIKQFGFERGRRFSQFISPFFDAFLRDIFVPLLSGGTICIPPSVEDFFTPEKMAAWINNNKINTIHCVPSMFRVINNSSLDPNNFEFLTHVLLSGEKLVPLELNSWYQVFGSRIQLVNLYGTTETTMIKAYYEIRPEDVRSAKISIGYPIADTELLICNNDLKPCQPLVPGDLYIISKYTTKGYLNDPDLTKEKFIKWKEGTSEETIAFKTGDRARKLADGRIDLLGREDRQVKINGIRVELDEIENLLLRHPLVRNAIVVFNQEVGVVSQSIMAFITKKDSTNIKGSVENSIKEYLANYLPNYMLPTVIIEVDKFPLLSNGKTDIQELVKALAKKDVVQPVTKLESELLIIWKEVFGDYSISTEDEFQNLGGNSLSILALVSKIYKQYNVRLSLSQIVSHNSIQKQARFIAQTIHDNSIADPVSL